MPLPGGAADKFGNRYEGRWTVACLLEVLSERAESLRIEPPGVEGEGAEFWLRRHEGREYHQVKRQHGGQGRWSLSDLDREGVLTRFFEKLDDPTACCVFVSTHAAYQLAELSERARGAASLQEFQAEFLKGKQYDQNFGLLRGYLPGLSPRDVYDRLKRIKVRTQDEQSLRSLIEALSQPLVDETPAAVVDILAQLALDSVHQELTAHDIWQHLEAHGHRRRSWNRDPHVLAAVDVATRRYSEPLSRTAIGGTQIPREEAQKCLQVLEADGAARCAVLCGEAGGGKSSVAVQVLQDLRDRGWPVLAFRIDRLGPTGLPDDVGDQLGLPGSPANVLAAVAQGSPCALIIDQLDAVSLASGRFPGFFDCIDEIMTQVHAHQGMRLVLACRAFDLENDHRLRRLKEDGAATVITVARLTPQTVQRVVAEAGANADAFTPTQLSLLALPLHLSLFVDIVGRSGGSSPDFTTAKDLYDLYWERKRALLRERTGRSVSLGKVVEALCDYMSERQVLAAPVDIVEEWADDAAAMASEHILVRDESRYAFFHEGFFDYAFARHFAGRGHDLLPILLSGEQHLFRRAQVRQVLLHERDAERIKYLTDLRALLTHPDVRFHIKQVVFALLARLGDPSTEEWAVLESFLGRWEDGLAAEGWQTVHRSIPWVRLLDVLGVLERWLADPDDRQVNSTIQLLQSVQRGMADRVADLVAPYAGISDAWRERLVYLMQWGDIGAGRRFFDLFLRLVDEGLLDDAPDAFGVNRDFWSLLHPLEDARPAWACEAMGHHLERRLALSLESGQPNPFDLTTGTISSRTHGGELFDDIANMAPAAFVENVMPFMLRVMELTATRQGSFPWRDPVWSFRHRGDGHGVAGALLAAMETALQALARDDPERFQGASQQLRGTAWESAQYLLVRGYTANGVRFADEAADYLSENPARLHTGYNNSSHWAARELIEAVSPRCSTARLAALEQMILHYVTEWERSAAGRRSYGRSQLILLEGIDPPRRSAAATRRLQELRRRHSRAAAEPPRPVEAQFVGSPVPESAADKMTDAQWLGAIARYYSEDMSGSRGGKLVGGATQLANLLEQRTIQEPARFLELALRFPDDTHPAYFVAVLGGVATAGVAAESALRLCQRCHRLPHRPCGREICRLIGRLAAQPLPYEALEIVAWYAAEDPDPQREPWPIDVSPSQVYVRGDLLTDGINSVRGTAAGAIRDLLFEDGSRLPYLLPTLQRLFGDGSVAVRACAASALIAVLYHDRDLAITLFSRLCDSDNTLLSTWDVEQFLFYAVRTHFTPLQPILERMMRSETPATAAAGSRLVCLASLTDPAAQPLAEACLSGSSTVRVQVRGGVA